MFVPSFGFTNPPLLHHADNPGHEQPRANTGHEPAIAINSDQIELSRDDLPPSWPRSRTIGRRINPNINVLRRLTFLLRES
jgi:hypothetical protein